MMTVKDIISLIEHWGMSQPYNDNSINVQMHYLAYTILWKYGEYYG